MRIGQGYDAHRFGGEGPLVVGGEKIDYEMGMVAHSDGDVLVHALCDALLGAAGLGDIGHHFPDSDAAYENIDSRVLLRQVVGNLAQRDMRVGNVDITLVAQAPKMAPHIQKMRENLSADLGVEVPRVNVKATTTEGMGFAGRKEGIACYAAALLETVG
ncbi:2-C-methyl-D-erythritol 2,4-cyclodiphosphate synthase [Solemya velesiana gill symbiont]|uniref:2-C-methyl-D-erythritol 2,4-cyclodiphosphate synthase n=1 Tax=Solemya velesiana gill symbiont TaxID=1918948 RepID=A0A1T2KTW8_9GAMM|nr:2-C-methyl-D-erythritol 2,4-cyclodiphosphate synthase [Solemya velesiana gill symbiont]OOZ36262.1 2-C-methyl-D-erythritol 2,4-cyclodiphosphate synthase [Solemya velesiana gill symbiont]